MSYRRSDQVLKIIVDFIMFSLFLTIVFRFSVLCWYFWNAFFASQMIVRILCNSFLSFVKLFPVYLKLFTCLLFIISHIGIFLLVMTIRLWSIPCFPVFFYHSVQEGAVVSYSFKSAINTGTSVYVSLLKLRTPMLQTFRSSSII